MIPLSWLLLTAVLALGLIGYYLGRSVGREEGYERGYLAGHRRASNLWTSGAGGREVVRGTVVVDESEVTTEAGTR